jgi:predicted transcriptional regulator YdeE
MRINIIDLEEKKLVGLRVVCPGDQYVHEIPKATARLIERLNEISRKLNPSRLMGAFIVGETTADNDGYWVCTEVEDFVNIPNDMVTITIPKQRYAVIKHEGPNFKIMNTYERLHKWIYENGYERNFHAWHLEIYEDLENIDKENLEVFLYDTILR